MTLEWNIKIKFYRNLSKSIVIFYEYVFKHENIFSKPKKHGLIIQGI